MVSEAHDHLASGRTDRDLRNPHLEVAMIQDALQNFLRKTANMWILMTLLILCAEFVWIKYWLLPRTEHESFSLIRVVSPVPTPIVLQDEFRTEVWVGQRRVSREVRGNYFDREHED